MTLLTADEVAARLNVKPRHVLRLARERKIEHVKVGRYVRFEPESVENFIARNLIFARTITT